MVTCKDGFYERGRWHFYWERYSLREWFAVRGNLTPGEVKWLMSLR